MFSGSTSHKRDGHLHNDMNSNPTSCFKTKTDCKASSNMLYA